MTGTELFCPLKDFEQCEGDKCAWYVKKKDGAVTYFNGDICAITKLVKDGCE